MTTGWLLNPLETYSRPLRSLGSRRNAFGELVEFFAAEALGAQRRGVFTDKLCPDLTWHGRGMEVKANAKGRFVIYPFRLRKEQDYQQAQGQPYLYALADYCITPVKDGDTLTLEVLRSCSIYMATLDEIVELCAALPVRKTATMTQAAAWREGYKEGFVCLPKPKWVKAEERVVANKPVRYYYSPQFHTHCPPDVFTIPREPVISAESEIRTLETAALWGGHTSVGLLPVTGGLPRRPKRLRRIFS